MGTVRRAFAVLGLILLLAQPALAHPANLTFTFLEGPDCPDGQLSCIEVTGEQGTEGNIPDDFARVVFVGEHPVQIDVQNQGNVAHQLAFEPGTDLDAYSMDEPIDPGETATISFTTIANASAGKYKFFDPQDGHRDLGESGTFEIEAAPQPQQEEDNSDLVNEIVGVPAPGPPTVVAAIAGAMLALQRRD